MASQEERPLTSLYADFQSHSVKQYIKCIKKHIYLAGGMYNVALRRKRML